MDFPVVFAALAVNLLTAWAMMAHADPTFTERRPRPAEPAKAAPEPQPEPDPGEAPASPDDDDWIARSEPLVVSGGAEALGATAPVLAYIKTPRRSPSRKRLIQTEVLLPDGPGYRALALLRLVVSITVFGVVLGLTIIGTIRAVFWAFESAFGA